jgi:uncharacterized protein (TIGR02145 family)
MKKSKIIITVIVASLFLCSYGNAQTNSSKKQGPQIWATENLDVNKFRNGDDIPEARTDAEWKKSGDEQKPAWCYYNSDPANGKKYGKLYNWFAVNDPRGLAPLGWHVPTNEEWTTLTDSLGKEAGTLMKSVSGWKENGNGTNLSGFTAFPGGYRYDSGTFANLGSHGYWWSSTDLLTYVAWIHSIYYNFGAVYSYFSNKRLGLSVRCIKD